MRAEEIICLAILPEDVAAGIQYASQSLRYTFDRMNYGEDMGRRFNKIACGKACEATLTRYLRQHAIPHLSREGATPHTQPDRFDLRILNEVVDLKTFHVPDVAARPDRLLACLALVPCQHSHDQWHRRRDYQRYLFGFYTSRVHDRLPRSKGKNKLQPFSVGEVELSETPAVLFLTAAPAIAACEQAFRKISAKTRCVQYPRGTRIDNMGCEIARLEAFQTFLENLENYQRR